MTARILIVDDVAANLRLLEAQLNAEYYQVACAQDGQAAIALADGRSGHAGQPDRAEGFPCEDGPCVVLPLVQLRLTRRGETKDIHPVQECVACAGGVRVVDPCQGIGITLHDLVAAHSTYGDGDDARPARQAQLTAATGCGSVAAHVVGSVADLTRRAGLD